MVASFFTYKNIFNVLQEQQGPTSRKHEKSRQEEVDQQENITGWVGKESQATTHRVLQRWHKKNKKAEERTETHLKRKRTVTSERR